jgi:hypothetical protein
LENVPAVESHDGQTYLESAKETKNVALAYRIGTDHFLKKIPTIMMTLKSRLQIT